ncbi:DUF692 domain-containing protein [Simiduia sp. 21SJ11W-1]|uniref:HvfB family MNIO-type RiPP peptide maturase n=1 Tax=Simiduia sp. 21SJ11W-1 TaxID=2909669 RepID=UPI00209E5EBA|nr:DUF692 domain-containing protein [Simiduia sp. 21SJ11W-1]UTA48982.1 DUF692 domain-containing protein [Simiduia sp. 21SJ11W-1]
MTLLVKPAVSQPALGAGLGLRRSEMQSFKALGRSDVDFMEVAPENWIGVGGRFGRQLREYTERFPLLCHGLSLSIGGPEPLDTALIDNIKTFLDTHKVRAYSEHLSYCSDDGHLYDLLPIPFTEEAVHYVAQRVREVQDRLERRIALENVSYYLTAAQQLTEIEFINAVIAEADCDLLLDVNNIYVNSINHGYDPQAFLRALPGERASYIHVAGHYDEAPDLKVDTHGADVIDPVWALLREAYALYGVRPTLLERDFNIPPVPALLVEVNHIKSLQADALAKGAQDLRAMHLEPAL